MDKCEEGLVAAAFLSKTKPSCKRAKKAINKDDIRRTGEGTIQTRGQVVEEGGRAPARQTKSAQQDSHGGQWECQESGNIIIIITSESYYGQPGRVAHRRRVG